MNPFKSMKTTQTKWQSWLAVLMAALVGTAVHADNSCIENLTTNQLTCLSQGTLVTDYILSPTTITVGVGQIISPPTASHLAMTNGLEKYYVTYICTPSMTGWQTSSIPYTLGSLYFVPSIPNVFWTPGTYSYAASVIANGSECSPLTNNLGVVIVNVWAGEADVLFNVDFGGVSGNKTGYAATGNSQSDLWNYYSPGGNDGLGNLTNLITSSEVPSPVVMSVANLTIPGANGSPDVMYNDFLAAPDNGQTATVTFTDLAPGTWDIYIYSDDEDFGLTVSDANNNVIADYGQECQDLPLSSPLIWQQGVQYVKFSNVSIGLDQALTVTVSPGLSGVASISGIQLATSSHEATSVLVPQGMVAWWRGESDATESIGETMGTEFPGLSYTSGMVDQAFAFDGVTGCVMNTNTPPMTDIQNTFTMEFWAYPQKGITIPPQSNTGYPGISGQSYAVFPNCGDGSQAGAGVSIGTNGIAIIEHGGGYMPSLLSYTAPLDGWVHIAIVYINKQPILYVNGVNVKTGITSPRSFVYPSKDLGGNSMSPWNSYGPYKGFLDEISIYDRALSSQEIASIYNAGPLGKGVNLTLDSDYDGVSDLQEMADRTDPHNPNSVSPIQLGCWPFADTNTWTGSAGQLPLIVTNVGVVADWCTNAVVVNSTNSVILAYRDVETNGSANINLRCGTIKFWFEPYWGSAGAGGAGPGVMARLIEVAQYAPDNLNAFTNGWWALYVSPDGTQLCFGSSTNGGGGTNLAATIAWTTNQWHQVVLTYTTTNSLLYIDGQLATNGIGPIFYPNLAERQNGFRIGSDQNGNNQAAGAFADVETFNYPVSSGWIVTNFLNCLQGDNGLSGKMAMAATAAVALAATTASPTATIVTSSANPVCVGSTVTFTATVASGVNRVTSGTVQFFNGTVSLGTVSLGVNGRATLTIATLTSGSHVIKATFSGSTGYASSSGTLTQTIGTPLTISTQPASKTVCSNSTATFKVAASGATSYEWQVDTGSGFADVTVGTGGKTASYSLIGAALTPAISGAVYRCIVGNAGGCSAISSSASLTVNGISSQPASATICVGNPVVFSVAANGTGVTYQWQVKKTGAASFSNMAGANTSSYTINSVTTTDAGSYRCMVTVSGCGSETSVAAVLTANTTPPPSITSQPANQSVLTGASTTFTVAATVTAPYQLSYQWQVNSGGGFVNVTGGTSANTPSYMIPAATIAANGSTYQCVVTASGGCPTISSPATLTVADAPGDSDGDGLPDTWEMQYFGHLGVSLTADYNNSGLTVLQDYQLGLNPLVDQTAQTGSQRNYNYDLLDRLTHETGDSTVTIAPDSEGNIQQVTPN